MDGGCVGSRRDEEDAAIAHLRQQFCTHPRETRPNECYAPQASTRIQKPAWEPTCSLQVHIARGLIVIAVAVVAVTVIHDATGAEPPDALRFPWARVQASRMARDVACISRWDKVLPIGVWWAVGERSPCPAGGGFARSSLNFVMWSFLHPPPLSAH